MQYTGAEFPRNMRGSSPRDSFRSAMALRVESPANSGSGEDPIANVNQQSKVFSEPSAAQHASYSR